jgi:hypothetical protein
MYSNLPAEIRKNGRFVVYRNIDAGKKKPSKIPYQPNAPTRKADITKPETWSDYETALAVVKDFDGMNVVCSKRATCVDLDSCVTDGVVSEEAKLVMHSLPKSYWELSPSGTGLRGIFTCDDEFAGIKNGWKEAYSQKHFMSVTGHVVLKSGVAHTSPSDFDKLRKVSASAVASTVVADKLQLLLSGDFVGQSGHSEADLSLCATLARKGLSREAVEAIWRGSGLNRTKTDRADYRKGVLDKAFEGVKTSVPSGPIVGRHVTEFLKTKYKEREVILKCPLNGEPMLRHPSLVQIHAWRGVGKTSVALHLADALANKREFFRWTPLRKMNVAYVEGEQPSADLQEHIREFCDKQSTNLFVISLEDQVSGRLPRIVDPEGQLVFEEYLKHNKIEVAIFDSLSTLANIPMNEEEQQILLGDWFIRLRTILGITVLYLQHDGKGLAQRGHSKHEDWIDLSIQLVASDEQRGTAGLDCTFLFDKARRPIPNGRDFRITMTKKDGWQHFDSTGDETKRQACYDCAMLILKAEPKMKVNELCRAIKKSGKGIKRGQMLEVIREAREKLNEATKPR